MTKDVKQPPPLVLPAALDTRAAPPLREALLARRGEAVTLDGSEVVRLGGLCLEVLLSARRSWGADGHPFAIHGASDALREALTAFGAADLLGDPA